MASKAKRLRKRQARALQAQKTQQERGDQQHYGQSVPPAPAPRGGEGIVPTVTIPTVEIVGVSSSPTTRAKCPVCGFSHKVKTDGTMGKHTAGNEGRACEGVGRPWNALHLASN